MAEIKINLTENCDCKNRVESHLREKLCPVHEPIRAHIEQCSDHRC